MSFENLLFDCQRKLLQDLRKLSTEELTKMSNSPFLLDIWIKQEEKVTSFLRNVDSHRKVAENYKEINIKLKNQIAIKNDALRNKKSAVKKLKSSLERLKKEKNEAEEAHSFYALINVLEVIGSEADEESEKLLEEYLKNPVDISELTEKYTEMRVKSHSAKEKQQRLKEIIVENRRILKK